MFGGVSVQPSRASGSRECVSDSAIIVEGVVFIA